MALLKSFWRRHSKQEESRQDAREEQGPASPSIASLTSQLTHTSEYHLERLETLIQLRYRKTPDGDDDEALLELVRFASRLQDQDIQRELLLFYLNCPPAVQVYLRSGDMVEASHYIHQAPHPEQDEE